MRGLLVGTIVLSWIVELNRIVLAANIYDSGPGSGNFFEVGDRHAKPCSPLLLGYCVKVFHHDEQIEPMIGLIQIEDGFSRNGAFRAPPPLSKYFDAIAHTHTTNVIGWGLNNEISRQGEGKDFQPGRMQNPMRGGLPRVLHRISDMDLASDSVDMDGARRDIDIGPKLLLGVAIGVGNEASGGQPKHPSDDAQQPLTRLNPEDRQLASVLATMLVLLIASAAYWRGWYMIGGMLAAYGIFGL
ncbi:hypothetical protein H8A99_31500 [Bradyrhizobium sp. Arg68]|uniref:hypothetical protein n=1 Tax=Bradyrhizobium ivorense TaxID=2511166 RepID=UPI001E51803F|nr:hypothetical protein [Bradyrhizobium ivorense]MCC8940845.1 hypothetical protein [Bradyrhizobium ivorense]